MYSYLHDQTPRLMNQGLAAPEIKASDPDPDATRMRIRAA